MFLRIRGHLMPRGVAPRVVALCVVLTAGCASTETVAEVAPETTAATATADTTTTTTDPTPSTATPSTATAPPTTAVPSDPSETTTTESAPCTTLADFSSGNDAWRSVNDGVMGGRSAGGPSFESDTMTFSGEINTNGGGFSSVRALLGPDALAGTDRIRVLGQPDGRTYRLILSDSADGRDRRVSLQADLDFTGSGAWQEAVVVYTDLDASVFGQPVLTDPFVPERAVEIGVQIADGIDGPFTITLDRIERCSSR